jgi:hypothetical protein
MSFFLKKIFEGEKIKEDKFVHLQFMKFSRGEFRDKAMLRLKNSSGKYTLDTTYEYARELVMALAEKLGDSKTLVTGALISALDLEGFEYKERKMAMGVRKYMIESQMTGKQIIELCENQTKAFIALSFNAGENQLVIQPKSPKSAKGASSAKKEDAEAKIDFCKLKTSDLNLIENFAFDSELKSKNFKKIEIKHDFIIEDIIIPEELKKEKDFAIIREKSLRKGRIIRKINLDGNSLKKETSFLA